MISWGEAVLVTGSPLFYRLLLTDGIGNTFSTPADVSAPVIIAHVKKVSVRREIITD